MNCPHDVIEIDDDNLPYCGRCGKDLAESYADAIECKEIDEYQQEQA